MYYGHFIKHKHHSIHWHFRTSGFNFTGKTYIHTSWTLTSANCGATNFRARWKTRSIEKKDESREEQKHRMQVNGSDVVNFIYNIIHRSRRRHADQNSETHTDAQTFSIIPSRALDPQTQANFTTAMTFNLSRVVSLNALFLIRTWTRRFFLDGIVEGLTFKVNSYSISVQTFYSSVCSKSAAMNECIYDDTWELRNHLPVWLSPLFYFITHLRGDKFNRISVIYRPALCAGSLIFFHVWWTMALDHNGAQKHSRHSDYTLCAQIETTAVHSAIETHVYILQYMVYGISG